MDEKSLPEESIFAQALEISSTSERAAFLDLSCGENRSLRDAVESLLRAHERSGDLLDLPEKRGATVKDPISERPGTVIGSYKLLEQIGEGGFGVVFMAEQTQPLRRKVALKVLKPGMDTRQVVARFEAERQALAIMDHPNIARVFDGGETTSGRPYFVMELVRGIPITEFCDQNQLSVRERLELFVSVCQAVQHAHQKGIIHRDLKPSNVLVTLHDGTPVVKVIDFGVAKAMGQDLTDKTLFTGFAQMIGTPLYMSPEQAGQSGLDVDTRSDIYTLGVLLYELLTGTTPFDKERLRTADYDEMRRIIREEEAPKPSTRISTLGQAAATVSANRRSDPKRLGQLMRGELDWIIMKALEKDRNRRYESASTFAADVQRFLRDEAVQACPPSAWYRLRKVARRNKAAFSIIGLVLFFLVLIGNGVGWAVRDRAARQAKLNREVEHALEDAAKARDLAQKLTDNPYGWEAALAEATSELKRAQGLAAQDDTSLDPVLQVRLQEMEALLNADEADRRFAARFEDIRLEVSEVHKTIFVFKEEIIFPALKEAFQHHYRIAFGATPIEQAVTILRERPQAMQDILLAALAICLKHVPQNDPQMGLWLEAVRGRVDTGPWRTRTQEALKAKDWKAFEQIFAEAVTARQPPSMLYRLLCGIPTESPICLQLWRRLHETYPGDFWINFELAYQLRTSQPPQLEEALRYYTAALALRPRNPGIYVILGGALRQKGLQDEALACYRKAIELDPKFAFAHNRLGADLGNLGRDEEAIACFRKAIECDPKFVLAYYNLGNALIKKGRPEEAIACNRQALELDSRDCGCRNHLAWILVTCADLKLRNPAEGLKLAQENVKLVPRDGSYWNTLGAAHYRAENWKEAIAALQKSMSLRNGGDSYDWFFLAMAYWQLGEKGKARQSFEQAVAWMEKNAPKDDQLLRFRAEAAELLKIQGKNK
jgi:serine/threonine protein kinase/Flp pilus assembly protein TadD